MLKKVSSFFALAIYTILSMKLISYFQVNAFLRRQRLYHQDDSNSAVRVDKNNNTSTVLNEETSTDELIVIYPNNLNHKGKND